MGDLALYGVVRRWPRWWIRARGLWWLRRGFCPCCYSSPPLVQCPVCRGDRRYGNQAGGLRSLERRLWGQRWRRRCT